LSHAAQLRFSSTDEAALHDLRSTSHRATLYRTCAATRRFACYDGDDLKRGVSKARVLLYVMQVLGLLRAAWAQRGACIAFMCATEASWFDIARVTVTLKNAARDDGRYRLNVQKARAPRWCLARQRRRKGACIRDANVNDSPFGSLANLLGDRLPPRVEVFDDFYTTMPTHAQRWQFFATPLDRMPRVRLPALQWRIFAYLRVLLPRLRSVYPILWVLDYDEHFKFYNFDEEKRRALIQGVLTSINRVEARRGVSRGALRLKK